VQYPGVLRLFNGSGLRLDGCGITGAVLTELQACGVLHKVKTLCCSSHERFEASFWQVAHSSMLHIRHVVLDWEEVSHLRVSGCDDHHDGCDCWIDNWFAGEGSHLVAFLKLALEPVEVCIGCRKDLSIMQRPKVQDLFVQGLRHVSVKWLVLSEA
jgi:hypothetical protein